MQEVFVMVCFGACPNFEYFVGLRFADVIYITNCTVVTWNSDNFYTVCFVAIQDSVKPYVDAGMYCCFPKIITAFLAATQEQPLQVMWLNLKNWSDTSGTVCKHRRTSEPVWCVNIMKDMRY